ALWPAESRWRFAPRDGQVRLHGFEVLPKGWTSSTLSRFAAHSAARSWGAGGKCLKNRSHHHEYDGRDFENAEVLRQQNPPKEPGEDRLEGNQDGKGIGCEPPQGHQL